MMVMGSGCGGQGVASGGMTVPGCVLNSLNSNRGLAFGITRLCVCRTLVFIILEDGRRTVEGALRALGSVAPIRVDN
jgi:hypothetical protein